MIICLLFCIVIYCGKDWPFYEQFVYPYDEWSFEKQDDLRDQEYVSGLDLAVCRYCVQIASVHYNIYFIHACSMVQNAEPQIDGRDQEQETSAKVLTSLNESLTCLHEWEFDIFLVVDKTNGTYLTSLSSESTPTARWKRQWWKWIGCCGQILFDWPKKMHSLNNFLMT